MKYLDFETWEKEHKDINNNLAVPSYRAFCKSYGINFHFGDEVRDFDQNKLAVPLYRELAKLHFDELPLHGKALNLFNFVNKPYHPFRESLVSFAYTSWDDFSYENLNLEEIAKRMENKDIVISKLESKSLIYAGIALLSSLVLTATVIVKVTDSKTSSILAPLSVVIVLTLIFVIAENFYSLKRKIKQQKFDKKLSELKQELKNISDRHKPYKKG